METDTDRGPRTSWFVVGTLVYLALVVIGAYMLGFFDPNGTPISPNEWATFWLACHLLWRFFGCFTRH